MILVPASSMELHTQKHLALKNFTGRKAKNKALAPRRWDRVS